jgi:hypothetical protein
VGLIGAVELRRRIVAAPDHRAHEARLRIEHDDRPFEIPFAPGEPRVSLLEMVEAVDQRLLGGDLVFHVEGREDPQPLALE